MLHIGGHTFREGESLCVYCGASRSGATLDAQSVRTHDGRPFTHRCSGPPAPSLRWWDRLRRLRDWTL